jgi:hypothetical protein
MCFLTVGCGGQANDLTVEEVKLAEVDLPGWTLEEEVTATPENAAEGSVVKQLYDAGAVTILNQVFEKDGANLQVNYVQMESAEDANDAKAILDVAVGGKNTLGVEQNMAFEIIGSEADREMAAEELGL